MKAVVYEGDGKISLKEIPKPGIIRKTDAIIKVTLTTICSSDLHIIHGAVPNAKNGVVLGHEFVGIVESVGSQVQTVHPGDRVAVNVETFCGSCFFCRRGWVNNCTDPDGGWALGCRIPGGQAEYVRIPYADNGLSKIPEGVSDEAALFTGDLLSTGYWAAKMAEIRPHDTVAVIGAGPAGMTTMMCARLFHPERILAVDLDPYRLEVVQKHGLADLTLNPSETDVAARIMELTDGRGADSVLEAAGGKDTFEMAWRSARPNAVVGLIAMYEEAQVLPLPDMYGKNLIFKTGGVDAADCGTLLELIAQKKLDTGCLITHRTTLDKIMDAYKIFEEKKDGVIKYAIRV